MPATVTRRRSATRPAKSAAERAAATEARAEKVAALTAQIGEQVQALTSDPEWKAMLEVASHFHNYSLNNQFLIALGAAAQGFEATRVAGFNTWKKVGRSVRKGSKGLAILAPIIARTTETDETTGEERKGGRAVRGFRVAYVFDLSQTDGDPLPDVSPALLTGDAPTNLWDALVAQIEAHGYTVERGDCHGANGYTDPVAKVVRVRDDVEPAQAVKTLAHELGHIECGHVTDGYNYRACRGQAEAEAESVAYVVTNWAGLDAGGYTVPYVAGWSKGDPAVLKAAALTVNTAAHRILDALDPADADEAEMADAA